MLRLPPFRYHRPDSLQEAVELLAEHTGEVLPVAGGTDLIPNMKHRLFTPGHLVALGGLPELKGFEIQEKELVIGAGETLSHVARSERVRKLLPALAEAAAHVAGPQLRNRGTLGGNLCLDTRCTYYNQTEFWRKALGYCLKKDGEVCHVTRVGKKCVAAHSADTPPVLMTVDATAELVSAEGTRSVPVRDFFLPDGVWNTRREPGEVVRRIRIPLDGAELPGEEQGLRRTTGYTKLRQRKAVDFPLLTLAVALWLRKDGTIARLRGVVTGLGSRPRELTGWDEIAEGERLDPEVIEALAERAHKQCTPLENHIVDPEWRKAMVPVQVRRLLGEMAASGPRPVPS